MRGFTAHPNSGVDRRLAGTYAGLVAKIPYLQSLGITAVELMPVQAFDAQDAPPGLPNYWGYSPVSFFAPHAAYASTSDPLGALDEFRTMVKELHRAGIEVILDVVFNHTAEAGPRGRPSAGGASTTGPTTCSTRATRRSTATTRGAATRSTPTTRRACMTIDALHHWVDQMHVDGFRFDLASIMSRDTDGTPLANPPVIYQIESDPVLAGTKLIAEAWDSARPLPARARSSGDRWREWNGQFRDDIRRFVRGDAGTVAAAAQPGARQPRPLQGAAGGRRAQHQLRRLPRRLHAQRPRLLQPQAQRGELPDNRDGTDADYSMNCGVEGPSATLRSRPALPTGQEPARHHADLDGRAR